MDDLQTAIALVHAGERAAAREALARLWERTSDAAARCAIAHFMADVQDDVEDELRWDLRALELGAAEPSFLASLHLNVGDAYRRAGDADLARAHARQARAHARALGDDGYARTVKAAIERLLQRVGDSYVDEGGGS